MHFVQVFLFYVSGCVALKPFNVLTSSMFCLSVFSFLCSLLLLPSVYCVTSPCKDDRYRAPPPTPPGYQGLSLGNMQAQADRALRPAYLKPPNYSMALQRSKLLGDTWRMADEHLPDSRL